MTDPPCATRSLRAVFCVFRQIFMPQDEIGAQSAEPRIQLAQRALFSYAESGRNPRIRVPISHPEVPVGLILTKNINALRILDFAASVMRVTFTIRIAGIFLPRRTNKNKHPAVQVRVSF
jgi:hypothetical protein